MDIIRYIDINSNNLVVNSVYEDSREVGAPLNGQPLLKLFPGIGNMKGIRVVGNTPNWKLYVLTSTESQLDWPDALDESTGILTYWGDNRTPGKNLHDPPGNKFFREIFARATYTKEERLRTPPGFYFTHRGKQSRDMIFRGMIIPKTNEVSDSEDLIAVWRGSQGSRFLNYRSKFTVLDVVEIELKWVASVLKGKELRGLVPLAWKNWQETGKIQALESPRICD